MMSDMDYLLGSNRLRSLVATVSLTLFVLSSAACASDGSSSAGTSVQQTSTESTVAITEAPTTQASTTEAPITTTTTTTTTSEPLTSALTQDEASAIAETIITAWNTDDVSPIEELMGPKDVWIAITGTKFDETTIAGWLDPILAAIGDTEHAGDPVAVTDGFSFPLIDVSSGGPFSLVITRSADGVLTIEESPTAP
jgi:hypothetical protein